MKNIGCGTQAYKIDHYVRKMGLPHFDILILITASRFSENDDNLINEINTMAQPVPLLLVRTKFDQDFDNNLRDKGFHWTKMSTDDRVKFFDETEDTIKQSAQRELKYGGSFVQENLFVVSNISRELTCDEWTRFNKQFMRKLAENRGCDPEQLAQFEEACKELDEKYHMTKEERFANDKLPTSCKEWNVEQTRTFVSEQTNRKCIAEAIRSNAIDGKTLVKLDQNDVVELGLGSIDIKRLFAAIDVAKEKYSTSSCKFN